MTLLVLLADASASASPLAQFAPQAASQVLNLAIWLLGQPLAWALITPWLTEQAKKLPILDDKNKVLVRAVASVLGVVTGFLASWATGNLTSFNVEQGGKTLLESVTAILAGFGVYDLAKERKDANAPAA